jgi:hypothetical protein
MTAYNIVRFRVKAGRQKEFEQAQRTALRPLKGFRKGALVKTGDVTYCFVGEWSSYRDIVNARPKMIEILDGFRDLLEDIGGGLGVTYAVSGEAVVELGPDDEPQPEPAATSQRHP